MKCLTVPDVRQRIDDILQNAQDDERAHAMENDLYENVLYTIAQNMLTSEEMALLALEVLRTKAIDFKRWCA